MDSSYISLLLFGLITIFYFMVLKPTLTLEIIDKGNEGYTSYITKTYTTLIIYFLMVVLSQFGINASVIVNKCGGSVSQNIGAAALMTFIPWFFIFGVLIAVLIVMPGFKSAFSNVIGYFVVSSKANDILTSLLIDTKTNNLIEIETETETDPNKKKGLESAAEAIIKLCGNMSILINQIVPENFNEYWLILQPLMKPEYKNGSIQVIPLKEQLLQLVVQRENIGEALWYIYTAVLLTSIIQYNLTTRGCVKDLASIEAAHQQFLEEEATEEAAKTKNQSIVYTTTN
jgi:hypothetical protein